MSGSRRVGWWRTGVGLIVALGAMASASPASAHDVRASITPPPGAAVEDSEFAIQFSGDMSSLRYGEGYLSARIRPGTQTPCATSESADPGDPVSLNGPVRIEGAFNIAGRYTADAPGDFLICVWVLGEGLQSGPPTAATMTVRPPVLRITAAAPGRVAIGDPFEVTVDYEAEVPRYLTVLVRPATRCPVASRNLGAIFGQPTIVADNAEVVGPGSLTHTIRLARAGTYVVCGYLDKRALGSAVAQLNVKAATITVPGPAFRACGSAGGRRHIRDVRARNLSCAAARSLARRWGARRPAPRRLGTYRCFARRGSVTCTAGQAQARFRYARRYG